jgi:intraflagellar transport protein 172
VSVLSAVACAVRSYENLQIEMQLKHVRTVVPAVDGINKVTAVAWAPNNSRAAIAVGGSILLVDERGEKRDKFAVKAADAKV